MFALENITIMTGSGKKNHPNGKRETKKGVITN
jgi:hypothetical protein